MPNNVHGIFLVGAGPVTSTGSVRSLSSVEACPEPSRRACAESCRSGLALPNRGLLQKQGAASSAPTSRTSYSGRRRPLSSWWTTVATLAAFGSWVTMKIRISQNKSLRSLYGVEQASHSAEAAPTWRSARGFVRLQGSCCLSLGHGPG